MAKMHWTDAYGVERTAQIEDKHALSCKANWENYFGKQINCWIEW